jgi:septum formation topological specificity factor MinE
MSDRAVRLTPERLMAMNREVNDVIERYIDEAASDDDPNAESCTVIYTSFPNPHPVL